MKKRKRRRKRRSYRAGNEAGGVGWDKITKNFVEPHCSALGVLTEGLTRPQPKIHVYGYCF